MESRRRTRRVVPRSPGGRARTAAAGIFDRLEAQHPNAWTELHFSNPYELLVATMLSAQSTDRRVNEVTPALFRRYPDAASLSRAEPDTLEGEIRSTGFFRMKTRSLLGMAHALLTDHGGLVPADMDALTALPGVGRKTANVVLGHALGVPGLPVDRHVLRVANRIGLVHSNDAEQVERALCALLPPDRWVRASDVLILHGRRVCRPTPACDRCSVRSDCNYYKLGSPKRLRREGGQPGRKRAR
jgi:endonuclease-3